MLNITLPIWLIFTVAGLPTLLLMAIAFRLMRLRRVRHRMPEDRAAAENQPVRTESFDHQVNQEIIQQQIDAVFDAMMTILQSEQTKLKALIRSAQPNSAAASHHFDTAAKRVYQVSPRQTDAPQEPLNEKRPSVAHPSVAHPSVAHPSVAQLINDGLRVEEIGRRLGLSQTEVALAMKINAGQRAGGSKRMEAIV